MRRWLTDSGGTCTSGKQGNGGDSEARKRDSSLEKLEEESKESGQGSNRRSRKSAGPSVGRIEGNNYE